MRPSTCADYLPPNAAAPAPPAAFVLLSIGAGNASAADIQNCTQQERGSSEAAAAAARSGGPVVVVGDPAQAGIITLSYAKSASGPWTTLPEPILPRLDGWENGFFTHPSLYFFENGTALMAYRGGQPSSSSSSSSSTSSSSSSAAPAPAPSGGGWPHYVGVARAGSWRGPYVATSDAPVFPDEQEDPGIFRDARGSFHMLTHDFAQPTGGHAFSADGLNWTFAGQAYGTTMQYADGSSVEFARRERPQVLVLGGKPAFLFTGALAKSTGRCATTVQPIVQD